MLYRCAGNAQYHQCAIRPCHLVGHALKDLAVAYPVLYLQLQQLLARSLSTVSAVTTRAVTTRDEQHHLGCFMLLHKHARYMCMLILIQFTR